MRKTAVLIASAILSMTVQNVPENVLAETKQMKTKTKSETQIDAPGEKGESNSLLKDRSNLSNERKDWYFKRNNTHTPPEAQTEIDLSLYDSYYLGDTSQKVIYMTFDSGYENGFTHDLLDILKEKQVPAAFFVLKSYISSSPELVKRMVDEGHIVANHSSSHKNFCDLTGAQIERELADTADYFEKVTGKSMPKFFRPPSGVYSERALAYVKDLGYKTVFWSFAYKDWDEANQPGKKKAYEMMVNNSHNGSIMMLHSVSKSNIEALPDAIDTLKAQGYVFKSLYEISGH